MLPYRAFLKARSECGLSLALREWTARKTACGRQFFAVHAWTGLAVQYRTGAALLASVGRTASAALINRDKMRRRRCCAPGRRRQARKDLDTAPLVEEARRRITASLHRLRPGWRLEEGPSICRTLDPQRLRSQVGPTMKREKVYECDANPMMKREPGFVKSTASCPIMKRKRQLPFSLHGWTAVVS